MTDDRFPADLDCPVPGTWKLLRHEQDVNTVEHTSVEAALAEDGTVSGAMAGSYALDEDGRIALTLDGVEYRGWCKPGYDSDQDAFVATLTAMSEDGQTLWGVRATGQD